MIKQDRFLNGILIGIAVLVVVALAVFFLRKDTLVYRTDDTPAGVVQNYAVALYKHDYQKAYGYLIDQKNKPTLDQFQQAFLSYSVDPGRVGLALGKTEIVGDNATVTLMVNNLPNDPFSRSYQTTDYAQLVRQGGEWKIKQMPYSFWEYDWYQPTPQK